jgi:antibiotic biosynthesis monooxygenase (ABM) superfamily enzyme
MSSMTANPEPVTVVVTRCVKAGRESDYEVWLQALLRAAQSMPGYLGANITRPPSSQREYTSVFRFDSVVNLRAFETSETRARAMAAVADIVEADAVWRTHTGLEFWFTPPPGTVVAQPSRWRMALLMVIVVYGLVLSIGSLVGLVLNGWPSPVRLLVTIIIEVALMTWVLMPRLTRWLARWIYPSAKVV